MVRMSAAEADYVIVGAGSAGCALAYRLSESVASMLVVEYGGSDAGPLIQMPGALSFPMNMKRYDWGYWSEPEPHLGGRRLACPRGKVIGGSSSINGMVYVRGHAKDFDAWEEMGASGWSYADVLPYYKRMESWDPAGHGGDASWRGRDGPLHVTRGKRDNPLVQAFVQAGRQAGYQLTDDYNGQQQEGFGPMEHTIHKGARWSAAKAYLRPALQRKNCNLIRGLAQKIVFSGRRAVGVELLAGGGLENRSGQKGSDFSKLFDQFPETIDALWDWPCRASGCPWYRNSGGPPWRWPKSSRSLGGLYSNGREPTGEPV